MVVWQRVKEFLKEILDLQWVALTIDLQERSEGVAHQEFLKLNG